MINKLKSQLKEMKLAEENATKKLEILERQSNYMRSRTSSAMTAGKVAEADNLEGVWQIVKEIREKMMVIQEAVEDGVNEKYKELNMSVIEKDNELIHLLEESDTKLREMKAGFRKELKELKEKHKFAFSNISSEMDSLKLEKVEFLKKINELEMERQNASLNSQKVKILLEQNDFLKKELKNKEENMTIDKEVLTDFVQQIEEKETIKLGLEEKFKEIKKKGKEAQDKLASLFGTTGTKKKMNDKEIQEFIEKVTAQVNAVVQLTDENTRTTKIFKKFI